MPQTKPQTKTEHPMWPWLLAGGIAVAFYGLTQLVRYVETMPLIPRLHG